MLFDRTVLEQVSFNPLEEFHPQLLVGHLTAAESQGYLGPVPITQETYQVAQFYLVIPFLRPWTKLDFFNLNLFLFFLILIAYQVLLHQQDPLIDPHQNPPPTVGKLPLPPASKYHLIA